MGKKRETEKRKQGRKLGEKCFASKRRETPLFWPGAALSPLGNLAHDLGSETPQQPHPFESPMQMAKRKRIALS